MHYRSTIWYQSSRVSQELIGRVNKNLLPTATLSSNIGPYLKTANQDRDTLELSKTLRKGCVAKIILGRKNVVNYPELCSCIE
jgi:hypothetical protein